MDFSLFKEFAQYGIFAGLFVVLLVWTIKSGEKRESELRKTLDKFADVVGSMGKDIAEVKQDVEDIKEKIK